jgi:hypothetical protein
MQRSATTSSLASHGDDDVIFVKHVRLAAIGARASHVEMPTPGDGACAIWAFIVAIFAAVGCAAAAAILLPPDPPPPPAPLEQGAMTAEQLCTLQRLNEQYPLEVVAPLDAASLRALMATYANGGAYDRHSAMLNSPDIGAARWLSSLVSSLRMRLARERRCRAQYRERTCVERRGYDHAHVLHLAEAGTLDGWLSNTDLHILGDIYDVGVAVWNAFDATQLQPQSWRARHGAGAVPWRARIVVRAYATHWVAVAPSYDDDHNCQTSNARGAPTSIIDAPLPPPPPPPPPPPLDYHHLARFDNPHVALLDSLAPASGDEAGAKLSVLRYRIVARRVALWYIANPYGAEDALRRGDEYYAAWTQEKWEHYCATKAFDDATRGLERRVGLDAAKRLAASHRVALRKIANLLSTDAECDWWLRVIGDALSRVDVESTCIPQPSLAIVSAAWPQLRCALKSTVQREAFFAEWLIVRTPLAQRDATSRSREHAARSRAAAEVRRLTATHSTEL